MNIKFGTNVSNKMSLNAANYSFYHFRLALIQIDEHVVDKLIDRLSGISKINDKRDQYIIKEINKKK